MSDDDDEQSSRLEARDLQHMLEQAQQKAAAASSASSSGTESGSTMEFSAEEQRRFKDAFESAEFRGMFAQYLEELQDPAARQESEAYIAQLERDNKVPAGKQLVHPTPAFVLKTHKLPSPAVSAGGGTSANTKALEKVFVNVVESPRVQRPASTAAQEGTHWSLPYSLGPVHMERDRAGSNAPTFDCCFHPEALLTARAHRQFHALLVQTALDGVELAYQRQQQQGVRLDRAAVRVVKGLTYLRGQVVSMLIDCSQSQTQWSGVPEAAAADSQQPAASARQTTSKAVAGAAHVGTDNRSNARGREGAQTSTATSASVVTAADVQSPAIKKGFLLQGEGRKNREIITVKGASQQPQPQSTERTEDPGLKLAAVASKRRESAAPVPAPDTPAEAGAVAPQYTLTERGLVSLGDFEGVRSCSNTSQPDAAVGGGGRPRELVYRIQLPALFAAEGYSSKRLADVVLDIAPRSLSLTYLDVYALSLRLPYEVEDGRGSAKFDRASQSLTVTLPLRTLPPTPPTQTQIETVAEVREPAVSVELARECTVDAKDQAKRASPDTTTTSTSNSNSNSRELHGRWVSPLCVDDPASQPQLLGEEESSVGVTKSVTKSVSKSVGESQCSLREEIAAAAALALELHNNYSSSAASSAGTTNVVTVDAVLQEKVVASDVQYVPSDRFTGMVRGMVFRRGDSGLGYYRDVSKRSGAVPVPVPESLQSDREVDTTPLALCMPTFDYRETGESVVIIVQVRNILAGSVRLQYQDSNAASLTFQALDDEATATAIVTDAGSAVTPGDASSSSPSPSLPSQTHAPVLRAYGVRLECAGALAGAAHSHDALPKNMVLVLPKRVQAAAVTREGDDGDRWGEQAAVVGVALSAPMTPMTTSPTQRPPSEGTVELRVDSGSSIAPAAAATIGKPSASLELALFQLD